MNLPRKSGYIVKTHIHLRKKHCMSNERRVYQADFKRKALELLKTSGRRGADVARDIG